MLAADFRVNYHSPGCSQTSSASSAAANMTSAMTTTAAMLVTSAVGNGTTAVVGGRGGGVRGVVSALAGDTGSTECRRESSLLFLLLVLGTVWLGLSLYNFTKTSVNLPILRFVLNYKITVILLKNLSN